MLSKERSEVVAARVSTGEREALEELARRNDRTPSREVHRAIRFYLSHIEAAERFLRRIRTEVTS